MAHQFGLDAQADARWIALTPLSPAQQGRGPKHARAVEGEGAPSAVEGETVARAAQGEFVPMSTSCQIIVSCRS